MNVGKKIRTLREAKGLSQADIEKRSGLLRSYVSRVENGHTAPSLSTLERFAKAIEVEPYQLLFEEQKPPRNFGPTLITTPFPSTQRVAKVFGISKERVDRISRWVEEIQKSNGKLRRAG
jgi:transcriptional regulator with XRE-family HTH domain